MANPELQLSGDMSPPHEPPATQNAAAYEDDDMTSQNRAIRSALDAEGLGPGKREPYEGGVLTYDEDGSVIEVFPGDLS